MSARRQNTALIGVGAVACAACCAGPILGFLAAIGLGTAAGFALFGSAALVIAAVAIVIVLRRRRTTACATVPAPVAVEMGMRTPR